MLRSVLTPAAAARVFASRSMHLLARPRVAMAAGGAASASAVQSSARLAAAAPVLAQSFTRSMSSVKKVLSDDDLRKTLGDAGTGLVVVDWYAEWCAPCRRMSPLVEQLAEATPGVTFVKADIDTLEDASVEAGVQSVPTFHFIKNGALVGEFSGADVNKLKEMVQQHK